MNTDYTHQLDQFISVLSHKDVVPTWVVSIISVAIGSLVTVMLGFWKERHDAKRQRKRSERAIYGELLLNYSCLLGTLVVKGFQFHSTKPSQTTFGDMFTFDSLDDAKAKGMLFDIPNFAVIRTVYKTFEMMSKLRGDEGQVQALAEDAGRKLVQDAVKNFETLFVRRDLNQSLLIELCETCAPNFRDRLAALARSELEPGQL